MVRLSFAIGVTLAVISVGLRFRSTDESDVPYLLSEAEKNEITGGEVCYIPDTARCPALDNQNCWNQDCQYDPENPPTAENPPQCPRDEEKKSNAVVYSKARVGGSGRCKVNPSSPYDCYEQYYCDVDCESDEFEWAWVCASTNILSGYSGSVTPTTPAGDDCPGCPLPPIAQINGLVW
jgi:hypothetical protein